MEDTDDAFLTEVGFGNGKNNQKSRHPKLIAHRKEHAKLMEIVESFGSKVSTMVDRQRGEYMQAYEHHMQDVQKELHMLRAKVTEIANDQTRGEKLQQLNKDQKFYRQEALTYDQESAVLRKKIRRLKDTIQIVEKERDWFLKKLREEKKRYNFIKEERAKVSNGVDSFSMASLSNDSYSLDVRGTTQRQPNTGGDWRSRLENDMSGTKNQFVQPTIPRVAPNDFKTAHSMPNLHNVPSQHLQRVNSLDRGLGYGGGPAGDMMDGGHSEAMSVAKKKLSAAERRARGELVQLKARQEAMRDFISHCAGSCGRGMWAKVPTRSLYDVLNDCAQLLEDPEAKDEERVQLARELAVQPETYVVISDILMGRYDFLDEASQGEPVDDGYGDMMVQDEDPLAGNWTHLNLDDLEDVPGEFPTRGTQAATSREASRQGSRGGRGAEMVSAYPGVDQQIDMGGGLKSPTADSLADELRVRISTASIDGAVPSGKLAAASSSASTSASSKYRSQESAAGTQSRLPPIGGKGRGSVGAGKGLQLDGDLSAYLSRSLQQRGVQGLDSGGGSYETFS